MTGDSLAFTQAKEIPMSDPTDVQNSNERMMSRMDLRGLRPNTVSTFTGCARRFPAQVGKAPSVVTAADVETFLLDLCHKGTATLSPTEFIGRFLQHILPSRSFAHSGQLSFRKPPPAPTIATAAGQRSHRRIAAKPPRKRFVQGAFT
jgi:hypothetical protein